MPVGMNKHLVPPPWLIAMQRYGPPPSYPNLRIPGLNAALPDVLFFYIFFLFFFQGAYFGYHVGGWGKPPVDETGRPLYGDVFNNDTSYLHHHYYDFNIDKSLWGEVESEESQDESDDHEEDMAEVVMEMDETIETGLVTPSGYTSGVSSIGFETPDEIELRKEKDNTNKKPLYSILPQKKVEISKNNMLETGLLYEMVK